MLSSDDTSQSVDDCHPLIDVDCNILHPDLASLLLDSSSPLGSSHPPCFRILRHPSTTSANIKAVFSPSSTLGEAELLYRLLHSSPPPSIDKILTLYRGEHPAQPFVTCVGETGIDCSEGFPDKDKQLLWFEHQLSLAKEHGLPLFLHERIAHRDLLDVIDEILTPYEPSPPIVIHCFTDTVHECKEYVKRGYYLSVSGYVLRKGEGPGAVRECLRQGYIPLNRLIIETDAPYMGFTGCRVEYYRAMEEEEGIDGGVYRSSSDKKKKKLIKSIYPNVPSALPVVLEKVVERLNERRGKRGEEDLGKEEAKRVLYETSRFFGF